MQKRWKHLRDAPVPERHLTSSATFSDIKIIGGGHIYLSDMHRCERRGSLKAFEGGKHLKQIAQEIPRSDLDSWNKMKKT